MSWTEITREQHRREGLAYASDTSRSCGGAGMVGKRSCTMSRVNREEQ